MQVCAMGFCSLRIPVVSFSHALHSTLLFVQYFHRDERWDWLGEQFGIIPRTWRNYPIIKRGRGQWGPLVAPPGGQDAASLGANERMTQEERCHRRDRALWAS